MPERQTLVSAELRELNADFSEKSDGKRVAVQFNPENLKVTFSNQIATPTGSGSQEGSPARLFVGAGSTKLAVQLWFDVTALAPEAERVEDVRELTREVIYFITPIPDGDHFRPPATAFIWGSFSFAGIVDSIEETLEFFAPDGKPLRAGLSIQMSQQRIPSYVPGRGVPQTPPPGAQGGPGGRPAGASPLTQAPAGASLQRLAASQGADWRAVAAANGIENPRQLTPGQLLDLAARR
ncbi:MAG: LysM peptidoglycan-binding domain-containing protein [Chloroflexaceae bacterium]|nr:LysM peptidoglycan-binding domain-containing protein [Chloroflexaceae bacterium]